MAVERWLRSIGSCTVLHVPHALQALTIDDGEFVNNLR